MKESKRQRQVAEIVRRNMGVIFTQEGYYIYGSGPVVTVTEVKMTSDLGIAKIYLSIYNTEDKMSILKMVQLEENSLRKALAHRIKKHVRRIPNIAIYLDETLDEMFKVDSLFDELHRTNQMGSSSEEE